jgi:hypothetical protein
MRWIMFYNGVYVRRMRNEYGGIYDVTHSTDYKLKKEQNGFVCISLQRRKENSNVLLLYARTRRTRNAL